MNQHDLDLLRNRVSLLADFPEPAWREIIAGSHVEVFEPGASIVHAGDELHFLGVVLEGKVTASLPTPDGGRHVLGQFSASDTFGEMSLMSGAPALADLVADSTCRVLLVPLTLFRSHIMSSPEAVRHLSQTIGQRFQHVMRDPAASAAISRKEDVAGLLELRSERPERILVLNCGSSSLKFSFFDTARPENTARGHIERIGATGTRLVQRGARGEIVRELGIGTHSEALAAMLGALLDEQAGVIRSAADVSVVGHRVVHGGESFSSPVLIDDDVLRKIDALRTLAPLHNPVNVAGIVEARRVFPAIPHVAVFDTAFHSTLPSHAYLYALPYELYEQRKIRRYGFHGSSHSYVALAAAQFLKRSPRELRIVSCHLGNGASLCAIDHGRSVDTTMGFTPGEGLAMGTRCGDVDAGVLSFLAQADGLSLRELDELLNRKSGLLGLSGISSDMREVEKAADEGHARALIAFKTFCYRIRKRIGAYVAAMGGIDVLIFTAGIGQGSAGVRAAALQGLRCMGIHLDDARNRAATGKEIARISADDSPVCVLVVPTDEERMIARETLRAVSREYLQRVSDARRTQPILIEVSAHHIHLAQEHVDALFGAGHQLTHHADLSQPGQFPCREQLTIVGPKGRIERVRVLGPVRRATQVEIAMTEQFKLGIHPPIRESGDIEGSPGCTIEGPAGSVTIDKGVICALRHIHMSPADALRYGLQDKNSVRVRVDGDRELLFGDVRIRVDANFSLAMHIDTDEANAAGLSNGAQGFIESTQSEE